MDNKIDIDKIKKPIEVRCFDEKIVLPDNVQADINAYWAKRLRENPKLRRGKVYCIRDIIEYPDRTIYNMVETDYAHYLYTLNCDVEEKYTCKVCFAVGLIITSDNKYIIGQMSKDTATPLRLQLPGGGLEEQDIIDGKVCLERNLDRELKEEIGFGLFDNQMVHSAELTYIKNGGTGKFVAFIYSVISTLTSSEYISYYKNFCSTLQDKPELCNIFLVDRKLDKANKFFSSLQVPVVDYLYPVILKDIKEKGIYYENMGNRTD